MIAGLLLLASSLGAVLDITTSFKAEIATGKPTMVKFFAPWCGHCKALAPKYVDLSEDAPAGVVIAEVDCTKVDELCGSEGVEGYPTVKFYKDGKFVEEYSGPREVTAMKEWITQRL